MEAHLASVRNGDEYAFLEALVLSVFKFNAITWIGGNNIVQVCHTKTRFQHICEYTALLYI